MRILKFILFVTILPLIVSAQNINGRFSASLYSFERATSATETKSFIRNFESLYLNVNQDKFALRTRLGFESNIGNALDDDPRLRVYNIYLEARDLLNIATLKLGRQPFYNTVAGGVYDGVNLKLKHEGYSLTGFYGGNVPAYQEMKLTDDWKNDYVLGAQFSAYPIKDLNVKVNYVDKNFKAYQYTATRLDQNFNPIQVLIEQESNQFKFVGGEVSYRMKNMFNVYTRYEHDLNFKTTSKFEILGKYEQIENVGISLYYNYREPRIRYNSIFSVFNYGNTQEIEAGVDYRFDNSTTIFGKFANVQYEDDNSQRATIGFNFKFGSVSYRKTFGYAGELDAISVYLAKSFEKGFITPSIGLTNTNYKLSADSERNSLMAVLAGVNLRPWNNLSFDLQGQYMNNKIYNNDMRVLFKINHWFNANLNLL